MLVEAPPLLYEIGAVAVTAAGTWLAARSWYHTAEDRYDTLTDTVVEAGEFLSSLQAFRDGATAKEIQTAIDEAEDLAAAIRRLTC